MDDAPTLSADDLARLEALLAQVPQAEHALRTDELHGMLYALAIGPQPFPADDDWIAIALDEDEGDAAVRDAELTGLLARFAAQVRGDIAAGRVDPQPRALRRGRVDYRSWCAGFLLGVEASPSDWYAYGEPEDFDELLGAIELIAEVIPERERALLSPEQWRKRVLQAEADLPQALARLRAFWDIVNNPAPTLRREGPKVGRNDPCPCGSGRKFKQCHGGGGR